MTSSLEAAAGLCRSRDQRKGARGGDREGAVDARDGAEPNERRAGPYGHRSHRRRDFPRRRTAVNDGRAIQSGREGRKGSRRRSSSPGSLWRGRNVRRRPDGDGNLPNTPAAGAREDGPIRPIDHGRGRSKAHNGRRSRSARRRGARRRPERGGGRKFWQGFAGRSRFVEEFDFC